MSCRDCLSRREFLAKSALAAAAAALTTGCIDGQFGPPLPHVHASSNPVTIKVSDYPGLQNIGTPVAVGEDRAVVRTGTSSFIALSMICTHQGCLTDIVSQQFLCPCHGSRFTNQGNVVNGPDNSPPSTISPLTRIATTYDAATDRLTIG